MGFFKDIERGVRHSAKKVTFKNSLPLIGAGAGALLGGAPGAGLGLGIGSMFGEQQGAQDANAANSDIAREQMRFQERMSNTAHQREVADLKKAGLNPILAANSGASSPQGASATMQNTMEGSAASAMSALSASMDLKKLNSEIELMNAQTKKTNVDAMVATRNIPEADIKNRIYKQFEPVLKWFESLTKSKAKSYKPEWSGSKFKGGLR